MKPAPFSYARAESAEDALGLLDQHGPESKLLAGGQSLIPLLNFRLARPSVLIDINHLRSLRFIRQGPDDAIEIGAIARQRDVERSALIATGCPLLAAAVRHVGHRQIRNRGTVGGSLAHADPAAEIPLAILALGGHIVARSADGTRTIAAAEFFEGLWETALAAGEMVEAARFPVMPPDMGWSFREVTHRAGDFAIVAAAVAVTADLSGQIASCSIALSGAESRPLRLTDLERALVGTACDEQALDHVREIAGRLAFRDDIHGGEEYRRKLAVHLVREGLSSAYAMSVRSASQT